jgi:hypothetical protein
LALLAHVPCPQLASPAGFGLAAPVGFLGAAFATGAAEPDPAAAAGAAPGVVAEAASVEGDDGAGLAGAVVGVVPAGAGASAVGFAPHAAAEHDD